MQDQASTSPSGLPPTKEWRAGTLVYTLAGLVALFAWLLLGDFALQLKDRSDTVTAQIVLKKFEATNFLIGLIIGSIPAAIGMIIGPIVAVKSDRFRSRWGRRIPFLLVPLPIVVLAMVGLATSPQLGGLLNEWLGPRSPGFTMCVLIAFSLFWVTFEFASTIVVIMYNGLINDVVPAAVIGRFFGFFRMVSLLVGIFFNTVLIKHVEAHFFWIFIGTGLVYGIGFVLMCIMVKEGEYPDPEPIDGTNRPSRIQEIRAYLRECFATPFYLWLFAGLIFCSFAFTPVNSFSIFYANSLGLSNEIYGRYVAASFVISFGLAYFLGSLADRFHPLRLGIICIFLYMLVSLFGAVFATTPTLFGVAFLAHTVISGTYFTSMASIGQRLYPRLKFAQFASAAGLLSAASGLMLPPTMGFILDASGNAYRLTFVAGAIFSCLGLAALCIVYRKFILLGGPKNYVAPCSFSSPTDEVGAPERSDS